MPVERSVPHRSELHETKPEDPAFSNNVKHSQDIMIILTKMDVKILFNIQNIIWFL